MAEEEKTIEDIRKEMSEDMRDFWKRPALKDAKDKLREKAKKKIEEIYKDCLRGEYTEYDSAQECLQAEARKAGLEDAYEKIWGTAV